MTFLVTKFPANCSIFVLSRLDKSAPIFRLAVMGADEIPERSEDDLGTSLGESLEEKLDHGWRIVSLPEGQLLLLPPAPGAYDAA